MKAKIKKVADLGSNYIKIGLIALETLDAVFQNETVQESITNICLRIKEIGEKRTKDVNAACDKIDELEKEIGITRADKCKHCGYLIGECEGERVKGDSGAYDSQICPKCKKETNFSF
jgi:predicted Zn-ribbon and HTH transcriptional regulator